MKVIITALSMAFLIGSVVGRYEQWFKDNHYTDPDAFYVAQRDMRDRDVSNSTLHPERETYEKIRLELTSIRRQRPVLAEYHAKPLHSPGQVYLTNYNLVALHKSAFGPIHVNYQYKDPMEGPNTYLVTLKAPYYGDENLLEQLKLFARQGQSYAVEAFEDSGITSIYRLPEIMPEVVKYTFAKGVHCFDKCTGNESTYLYVVIDAKTHDVIDMSSTPVPQLVSL